MTMDVLHDVTHVMDSLSPEQNAMLDRWSEELQRLLRTSVEQGGPAGRRLKNWLNGVWLSHPLHPALTDAVVGSWTTGALLDLVGASGPADAAYTVGVLAAVPTAMSGAADWADTNEEPRRIGLVHGLLNAGGLVCMIASLFARRNDRRALGIGLSTTGLCLSTISAWLGGHLVYAMGTNVNRAAFEPRTDEWQSIMRADALPQGQLTGAELEVKGTRVPLVLLKRGSTIMAIGSTCTHWGGPLAEGKLVEDDCVECPWHATRFRMSDGRVVQGPGTIPEHVYDVRVVEGNVQVRRRN